MHTELELASKYNLYSTKNIYFDQLFDLLSKDNIFGQNFWFCPKIIVLENFRYLTFGFCNFLTEIMIFNFFFWIFRKIRFLTEIYTFDQYYNFY